MCGIYGVVMRPGLAPDADVLDRMGQALIHRGPDGDGVTVEGRAGLGCRRLAIIDVEHGAQPLANEHGDVLVVCNGEIYNHGALRADEHVERRRDNRRELWALLVLQLWVDRNAATWHGDAATRVPTTHAVDLSVAH
jgi:asparagine synthase (glutamine-hydrolysing)